MSRCDLGRATAARIKRRRLVDAAAEQFKGPRIRFAGKEALKGEAKRLTLLPSEAALNNVIEERNFRSSGDPNIS